MYLHLIIIIGVRQDLKLALIINHQLLFMVVISQRLNKFSAKIAI